MQQSGWSNRVLEIRADLPTFVKRVSISQVAERKVQNLERPPDHNKVPRRASCASSMIAACWPSVSLLLLIVSAALATPSPPTCPAGATAAPNSTWGGVCFSLTTVLSVSAARLVLDLAFFGSC